MSATLQIDLFVQVIYAPLNILVNEMPRYIEVPG